MLVYRFDLGCFMYRALAKVTMQIKCKNFIFDVQNLYECSLLLTKYFLANFLIEVGWN